MWVGGGDRCGWERVVKEERRDDVVENSIFRDEKLFTKLAVSNECA
jgi:hypothetical protein